MASRFGKKALQLLRENPAQTGQGQPEKIRLGCPRTRDLAPGLMRCMPELKPRIQGPMREEGVWMGSTSSWRRCSMRNRSIAAGVGTIATAG
jgi:hypothetical protein